MKLRQVMLWLLIFRGVASLYADDWPVRSEIKSPVGNLAFTTRWVPAEGIHLQIGGTQPSISLLLQVSRNEGRARLLSGANAVPVDCERAQFTLAALPTQAMPEAQVLIKFRPEAWTVYLEDRPVVVLPAPFQSPTVLRQPTNEWPAQVARSSQHQKTGPIQFHDDFLVATNEPNLLSAWQIQSGDWGLHSVKEDASGQKATRIGELAPADVEFSANFYCLAGTGAVGVITAGYPFYDQYRLESAIRIVPGEMGLVFYFQDMTNYYAFTIKLEKDLSAPALLSLWRISSRQGGVRRPLAQVTVRLTPGQWVLPRVAIAAKRIHCWLDDVPVIDVAEELPPGGSFGLLVDSSDPVRFDDVLVQSDDDLDLRDPSAVKFATLLENGTFLLKRQPAPGVTGSGAALEVSKTRSSQWLVLGSPTHRGHVFAARFEPRSQEYTVGLLAGFQDVDQPYWRFSCRRSSTGELFRLDRVSKGQNTTVESFHLPDGGSASSTPVTLMADASEGNGLRLYRNGKLVLIHRDPSMVDGASGLFVGPNTAARILDLLYCFDRPGLYRNRHEKNRRFVVDPFMRNWSAPEGEWVEDENRQHLDAGGRLLIWHKSDFFGRFDLSLPLVAGSEVHLGVAEGAITGALVVAVDAKGLVLLEGARYPDRRNPLAQVALAVDTRTTNPPAFQLGYEDHWLWVEAGSNRLFQYALEKTLQGRRLRVSGFRWQNLAHSAVDRYNVKDYLFTEAPAEWVINGGRWQVINRFQCDPRWSHMNGESKDGLAALWTKCRFRGDFCVEMYAGLRHGWYEHGGDLNLTVMSPEATPGRGYTVTCSGWDPDLSQRYTRLYRDGQQIDQTDKYLVPRYREGSRRLHPETMISPGRDVHGAWYYIKLRRIGKRLEYYYDNELVFAEEDGEPLPDGRVGIWTFLNSIMVARVKIAAAEILPGEYAVTPVEPRPASVPPAAGPAARPRGEILNGVNPLANIQPAYWGVEDRVAYSYLTWHQGEKQGDYFVFHNTLGGGDLLTRCQLAPVPYADLAGWRFYVQRTAGAKFNFHYSLGRLDGNGQFVPQRRCFHRLSGTDFSKGEFQRVGATVIPGLPLSPGPWHPTGEWTRVEAWLPAEESAVNDTGLLVRVEGFGNLQPSEDTAGLTGNGPGQGYAVALFSEIRYRPPAVSVTNWIESVSFQVNDSGMAGKDPRLRSLPELQAWLGAGSTAGVNTRRIAAVTATTTARFDAVWIQLPERPVFTCDWCPEATNAVLLASPVDYPDRRFQLARLYADARAIPLVDSGLNRRIGYVPADSLVFKSVDDKLPLVVESTTGKTTFLLDRRAARGQERPFLRKLDWCSPVFENFEQGSLGSLLQADGDRTVVRLQDPEQGAYAEIRNRVLGQRLRTVLQAPVSLARFPVMQFRYRADEMSRLSLCVQDTWFVRLNEEYPMAVPVSGAPPFVRDGAWHTWHGKLSDAILKAAFDLRQFSVHKFVMGSFHSIDQTGRFSQWALDDIVCGPAVNAADALAFTPHYSAASGIKAVHMAVSAGPRGYDQLDTAQRAGLTWRAIPNEARTTPDISGLDDGLQHLLLKAVSRSALESAVTDLPYLLDRQPVAASASLETRTDPWRNGSSLRCTFVTGTGAPLALEELQFRWNDKPAAVDDYLNQLGSGPTATIMIVNWPYVFRRELDRMGDGDRGRIVIANIRDGAGNRAPDVVVPVRIDHASDHTGPTVRRVQYPDNILFTTAWDGAPGGTQYFACVKGVNLAVIRLLDQGPYLSTEASGKECDLRLALAERKWNVTNYPYFACRLRLPVIPTNGLPYLGLVLEGTNQLSWILPLTAHPVAGTNVLHLPSSLRWESNRWQTVAFNLRDLFKDRMTAEELNNLVVTALHVICTGAVDRLPLHLQNLFIYSDWRGGGQVMVDAYDVSGVAGLVSEYVNGADQAEGAPGTVDPCGVGNGWFVVRARDKAGNLSWPFRIPGPIPAPVRGPNAAARIEDIVALQP